MLLSLSWPTYGIPFFLFFALVPLLILEHDIEKFSKMKRKGLTVFFLGFLAFLIWNIVTTGWLYGSLNPDGSHSIPAVAIPVVANSLFYSLIFLLYHKYKKIQGTYWGLAFLVALWMSFEKLHLEWELTWPWLNLGNAFSEYPKLIQWYDTLGATGGSFWILLINVFAFYTLRIWEVGRKRKPLIKNASILLAGILVPMVISLVKYYTYEEKPVGEVSVLLLQPELDPYNEKYEKDSLVITKELLDLARSHSQGKIDYFIGPETSLPGYGSFSENGLGSSQVLNEVKSFLTEKPGAVFATGISSHKFFWDPREAPKNAYLSNSGFYVESYNTAIQLEPGKPEKLYHKAKLVPGVEIFPYMSLFQPILGNAMLNFGGTVASLGRDEERKVFTNSNNKGVLAPIICYESIYGEFTTGYVKNGANFLAIMTNDSWWGVTEGHRQLISYARLRAIETRREIARSANSGVSAHIDSKGEILSDTLYGDQTAMYAKIKLLDAQTFYTRAGDILSRLGIFSLGFLVFYTVIKQFQNRKKSKS